MINTIIISIIITFIEFAATEQEQISNQIIHAQNKTNFLHMQEAGFWETGLLESGFLGNQFSRRALH